MVAFCILCCGISPKRRDASLTPAQFNTFCKSLPHTVYVTQWGGAHVWKVGGPQGKLFAAAWFDDSSTAGITFKCSDMSFEMLKEVEGCRPAPYLASRGMKWIQRFKDTGLADKSLKVYLRESHKLAAQGLTKKQQRALGFI
jgi:predicted DNA-binding protein (MmcQ/YjbR family)